MLRTNRQINRQTNKQTDAAEHSTHDVGSYSVPVTSSLIATVYCCLLFNNLFSKISHMADISESIFVEDMAAVKNWRVVSANGCKAATS